MDDDNQIDKIKEGDIQVKPATNAIGLLINIPDPEKTIYGFMKMALESGAKNLHEVKIVIDKEERIMTFKEFKDRLFN